MNGRPHIGHAYEKILADALARHHRQRGDATFFLTGTDEHGQKIAHAAAAEKKTPKAYVDEYAAHFKAAWKALDISYDRFIRTSDQRHELAVQELFRRLYEARSPKTGQPVLFEEDYEGLYCEGCEAFKQEKDLDERGRCPLHLTVPKRIKETNFFFRLSEYDEALLKHIERHPQFIEPEYRRNEVLNVIRQGLEDVSVTRPNVPWGSRSPTTIPGAEGHTAYVWADALLNYLSAIGWPERTLLAVVARARRRRRRSRVGASGRVRAARRPGPAGRGLGGHRSQPQSTNAFHLIGKDISRFHCILWPALLLAAGVPLPRQVYIHGFIYARGERLSKSLGNVFDPVETAQQFGRRRAALLPDRRDPDRARRRLHGRAVRRALQHAPRERSRQPREPHAHHGAQVLRRRGAERVGSGFARRRAGLGGARRAGRRRR